MSFKFNFNSREYYFLCDKCEKVEIVNSIHFKPEGWVDGSTTDLFKSSVEETFKQMYRSQSMYDKYHYYEYGDFHFCTQCVFRQEIKEVFE